MLLNLEVGLCNYRARILTAIILLQYHPFNWIGKLIFTCAHLVRWHIYFLAYLLTNEHE